MGETTEQLRALHAMLIALNEELARKIATTSDIAHKEALFREMMEVGHRITMVGGLLFSARTRDLTEPLARVAESRQELQRAIEKFESINRVLRAISSFLGIIDKIIDLVKPI